MDWVNVEDFLPEKGLDVKVKDSSGNESHVFRCACSNRECKEWRCSTLGYHLMIEPTHWLLIHRPPKA